MPLASTAPHAPTKPNVTYFYVHTHDWYQVGATLCQNSRWSSVWLCQLCPDVGDGGYTGPDPDGLCACQFVTSTPGATKCADCGRADRWITPPPAVAVPDPLDTDLARWLGHQHDLLAVRLARLDAEEVS